MKNKIVTLYFIGDGYYSKSGSMMSSIYVAKGHLRSDWGQVQMLLKKGNQVNIRPATETEINLANTRLLSYL